MTSRALDEQVVRKRLGVYLDRGKFGAWLTLTHLHVAFVPVMFVLVGALLSGQILVYRLLWGCLGLLLGKQGFYFYDEATGRQWASRIPRSSLRWAGHAFVGTGFAAGLYTVAISSPYFLAIVALIGALGFGYNWRTIAGGRLHSLWNFSFTWATLPLVGGWFLMTNTVTPSIVVLGLAAGAFSSLVQRFSWIIKLSQVPDIEHHSREGQLAILLSALLVVLSMVLFRLGL